MNTKERLTLDRMISEHNVTETTGLIRDLKHSVLIDNDVKSFLSLKDKYERLSKSNPIQFNKICESKCNFIFTNYTDIYNKLRKNEISIELLYNFLSILKQIEDGKIDQHEGSYEVGKILKEIYVDSVLKQEEKSKSTKGKKKANKPVKNISWAEFKQTKLNK